MVGLDDSNATHQNIVDHNDYNKERVRRHHQRISEKYWKEKQNDGKSSGKLNFFSMLGNTFLKFFILATQGIYLCYQCKSYNREVDRAESTFL